MIRRQRNITSAIALALALTTSVAPAASADSQPLTQAEAAIANAATHTGTGPCSEVCSAGGYGSVSQPAVSQARTGAALPHDPRSRAVALASNGQGSLNVTTRTPTTTATCGDVCSGRGYGPVSAPATVVRVVAPGSGFDWGDAGIGAGGAIVLVLIGTGAALATTSRRGRSAQQQQMSPSS
jgi:hypothetical protein